MECPNCKYVHGYVWNDDGEYVEIVGKDGDYYTLPIKMERPREYAEPERANVYGCPACKVVFIIN